MMEGWLSRSEDLDNFPGREGNLALVAYPRDLSFLVLCSCMCFRLYLAAHGMRNKHVSPLLHVQSMVSNTMVPEKMLPKTPFADQSIDPRLSRHGPFHNSYILSYLASGN
jgi:hypothetical protein